MFATMAPPLPKPETTIAAAPTHTSGAAAAPAIPIAKTTRKRTYVRPEAPLR